MKPATLPALTLLASLYLTLPVKAENLEHTQQLINTNHCPNCDLDRVSLVYADLSRADLSGAALSQANLSRVNLSQANLQGADLSGAVLFSANLTGADLRGTNLSGADLRGANLTGANLEGAKTEQANFLGATGLPSEIGTAANYYVWGLTEAQRGNFRGSLANYNQAIQLNPEFAHAYLARGISRFQIGDEAGALQDGEQAERLYLAQANEQGHQASMQFLEGIRAYQVAVQEGEERVSSSGGSSSNSGSSGSSGGGSGGSGFLNFLGSLGGMLLQFLPYF